MSLFTPLGSARRRRRVAAGVALAAAAAVALSGCGAGSGSSAKDTLVVYTGQAGDYQLNLNPYSPSSIGGIGSIYESLFFITNVNQEEPVPLLGTDYAWNEDGTQLDVTLREGVKWSDGEDFTADDVVFTLQMIADTPSINSTGFDGEVSATDDTHVSITWDHPAYVSLPNVLSRMPIVPEHLWKDVDPATDVMKEPVGTGAFTLGDFKAQAFTLAANPDYWDGEPAVKRIRYLSLSGNTAGADALAAGTIDWQTGPVPDIANVEENYPGYKAITIGQNQMALITCSNADLGCAGPQTDPAVRHAIYQAMDRDQMNALAFQGTSSEVSPTFALLPAQEDSISADIEEKIAPMKPDTAGAQATLEAAGWAKGADGIYAKDGERLSLTVEVVTGWTDYITAIDTMAQQMKAAGIELDAAQSSWNEWTDKRTKGNYELVIDSLGQGPSSDPYYLYNNFLSSANTTEVGTPASTNLSRFADPEVDAALEVLASTPTDDTAARQAQFDVIQRKLVDVMPYIPIMTGGTTSEYNDAGFTGWPTMDDLYAFPAIWASPDNSQVYKSLKPAGE
jgi:peptide/nickel transport system substrate-binding protein